MKERVGPGIEWSLGLGLAYNGPVSSSTYPVVSLFPSCTLEMDIFDNKHSLCIVSLA